ncbi:hypothetical protein BTR14_02375 [Rhizobium rhizosphaerae]|uniref:BON domain-containing protein n=1 Tax=Xaviernesmea rhizosphaerae TaxID=1672749 RepID=A0ABX3PJC4_9HYPH|nr:BON domain-containing protein [Xaviernesmea rhizosphaerae]OQP88305.1 hypothetical protein BTR14_02375 [Xaviernesmea rhizosphaerae]
MVYKERMFHEVPAEEGAANGVAALEARIAEALAADRALDATGITVIARGTEILLGGQAGSTEEIETALEIAKRVDGVTTVVNEIALAKTGAH